MRNKLVGDSVRSFAGISIRGFIKDSVWVSVSVSVRSSIWNYVGGYVSKSVEVIKNLKNYEK